VPEKISMMAAKAEIEWVTAEAIPSVSPIAHYFFTITLAAT
jgi:hypothetical protein